jgi:DNA primase
LEEAAMPLIDYRQARREVRLAAVLELLRWQARERRGEQVRGPCPVHGSSSPRSRSFSAHLSRGVWQCFGCGASGNALELWMKVTGQPLHAAVLALYRQLGRDVPWLGPVPSSPTKTDKRDMRDYG